MRCGSSRPANRSPTSAVGQTVRRCTRWFATTKDVRTILSGDHLGALKDLAANRCDAAAVYSGAYMSAPKQGINVGRMRFLAITGRVPQEVVVASAKLPEDAVEQLKEILLDFDPQRDVNAAKVGTVLGLSGFASYDAGEFELIRRAAQQEGLIPSLP